MANSASTSTSTSTSTGDPFGVTTIDVRGLPAKVFVGAPSDLRAIWQASAVFGDRTYLVFQDERISYATAHRDVAVLANRLVDEYGVRQGDRVAIAMRNYPEWAVAAWATFAAGAVLVPLNAWWTGPELLYGLQHSGSVLLFADDERIERIASSLDQTDVRRVVRVRTTRTIDTHAQVGDWAAAIALPAWAEVPALPGVQIGPDDDATIMYTSGTTGRPKGAVATHRNFTAFLMNLLYRTALAAAAAPPADPSAPPVVPATLLTFPLFHVGGLQSFLMPYTTFGGKIVLMYKWDVQVAIDAIEDEHVTAIAGVPTTVFELLEVAQQQGRSLSTLAAISSGATLVPPELVRRIERANATPTNGYGLTETSGSAVANGGADYLARPDSVGRPISPVMDVRIADPADGRTVPIGDVGEIWLHGPTVVRGYLDNPQATAESFVDGWFRTGDLGRLDDDGFLYVVDRLKDVVIRGGENVYAAEVEAALYEHDDVVEAAIIGIAHPQLGEEVGAVVRRREGTTLTADDVRAHVNARLAAFKVPTRVWVVQDELPRNGTGKVLKRELRDTYSPS
jgi:long-chain acyl-CoA synthetase